MKKSQNSPKVKKENENNGSEVKRKMEQNQINHFNSSFAEVLFLPEDSENQNEQDALSTSPINSPAPEKSTIDAPWPAGAVEEPELDETREDEGVTKEVNSDQAKMPPLNITPPSDDEKDYEGGEDNYEQTEKREHCPNPSQDKRSKCHSHRNTISKFKSVTTPLTYPSFQSSCDA